MKKIISVFLCILTAFSLSATAFAAGESDCHASWKLSSDSTIAAGKTVDVKIYLKTDYVSNIFGAVVTYDKTFYEPANSKEADNFVIAPSIAKLGNKTVILSEKKAQSDVEKMYDESYTKDMRNKYALAWFSFTFLASKFSKPTTDLIPRFNDYTLVATLKLKVKSTVKSGLVGNIWLDEVYAQKDKGVSTRKYTFVAHGSSEIIGKCSSSVKYGQTVDFSQGVLYKSVKMNDVNLQCKASANVAPVVKTFGSASYTCSYSSSNPRAVSVDSKGNVTGLRRGSASVVCTVTDSNGNSATGSCTVNVEYTLWQWIIIIFFFGWLWY